MFRLLLLLMLLVGSLWKVGASEDLDFVEQSRLRKCIKLLCDQEQLRKSAIISAFVVSIEFFWNIYWVFLTKIFVGKFYNTKAHICVLDICIESVKSLLKKQCNKCPFLRAPNLRLIPNSLRHMKFFIELNYKTNEYQFKIFK